MEALLAGAAVVLFLTILLGLVRVGRGPTPEDRMVAALLFGTTGVGLLLVLAELLRHPSLRDVALVFAVLASVVAVVFTQRPRAQQPAGRTPATPREEDGL